MPIVETIQIRHNIAMKCLPMKLIVKRDRLLGTSWSVLREMKFIARYGRIIKNSIYIIPHKIELLIVAAFPLEPT